MRFRIEPHTWAVGRHKTFLLSGREDDHVHSKQPPRDEIDGMAHVHVMAVFLHLRCLERCSWFCVVKLFHGLYLIVKLGKKVRPICTLGLGSRRHHRREHAQERSVFVT